MGTDDSQRAADEGGEAKRGPGEGRGSEPDEARWQGLSALLDDLPGMVYRCRNDPLWTMEVVSGGCHALTGYTAGELTGNREVAYGDLIHPDDRPRVWDAVQDSVSRQQPFQLTYRIVTAEGETRWVWEQGRPVPGRGDGATELEGYITDITERVRTEEALRSSEARYRELVENLNDVIYRVSHDGLLSYVSPAVERILAFSPDDLVGRGLSDLVHPDDLGRVRAALAEVLEGELHPSEYRLRHRDGSYRWVRTSSRPLIEDGRPVGLQGVVTDISEVRQAEEEREQLQAELLQAQKMEAVGQLAGGVAHDFNNMLGVILGHTELMLATIGADDPKRAELEEIEAAARRSADLTRQLLAFARRQTIAPTVLDLNQTLAGMLKMLRRLIGEDVELSWRPGSNLWLVRMDPGQVDQILANLCVNARDAIAGAGRVTIETDNVVVDEGLCAGHPDAAPGEFVLLAVTDDGCGMDEATLVRVFEPFFTTKEQGHGSGLGLSTVYGIVGQNGGFVTAHSEPGTGTSFRVYLPRCDDVAPERKTARLAELPRGRGETVLLVEDEEGLLKAGTRILETLGYSVLQASSGEQALALADEGPESVDLLITDVVMPKMSGRELADRLGSRLPGLKVLYMSGYTADVIAKHGVLEEGVHFLQKPFSMATLARRVRAALED